MSEVCVKILDLQLCTYNPPPEPGDTLVYSVAVVPHGAVECNPAPWGVGGDTHPATPGNSPSHVSSIRMCTRDTEADNNCPEPPSSCSEPHRGHEEEGEEDGGAQLIKAHFLSP